MRKLVLILIAFIAAATFIRAFDKGDITLSASDKVEMIENIEKTSAVVFPALSK
jgi:hypothetical protein